MIVSQEKVKTKYVRESKSGKSHEYYRYKTIINLCCDNCDNFFVRDRGSMNPNRLNNNYFHVCENCDSKKFAQKKGVERKQVWNMSASSSMPIGKL